MTLGALLVGQKGTRPLWPSETWPERAQRPMGKHKGKPRPRDLAKTTPRLLSGAQVDLEASLHPESAEGAKGCGLGKIHHMTLLQSPLRAPAQADGPLWRWRLKPPHPGGPPALTAASCPTQARSEEPQEFSSDPLLTTAPG